MKTQQKHWKSAAAQRILDLADNPPTIEAAVIRVVERLLIGVSCPPTDLDAVKSRLNVKSFEAIHGLPISGELRKDGKAFKVVYSASLSTGRRRFTCAHELAHAVFESTGPNCPRYGRELERICDMLAGELLLPKQTFLKAAGRNIGPIKIYELATLFQVSLMATALRCLQLRGLSVFQVKNGQIAWGFGEVRGQKDLRKDETFRYAIVKAMKGTSGQEVIVVRERLQLLEWFCSGNEQRALFVLRPKEPTPVLPP